MDFFSIWHLLVILVIVLVLFGTSKVRNIGNDLGGAIKSFRSAMRDEAAEPSEDKPETDRPVRAQESRVIEGRATETKAAKVKTASRARKG